MTRRTTSWHGWAHHAYTHGSPWYVPRSRNDEASPELTLAAVLLKQVVEHSGYGVLLRKVPFLDAFSRQVLSGETTFPLSEYQVDIH